MLGCPSLELAFQQIVRERVICKPSFWPLIESDSFSSFLSEVRGGDPD
jgi:hypothetical protein